MSYEQLDKERRRGWRATVYATPEEAKTLTERFDTDHEVGTISPEAWAALGSKTKPEDKL